GQGARPDRPGSRHARPPIDPRAAPQDDPRFLADLIDPLEEEALPERRQRGARVRLCDRIREVKGLLSATPEEALLVTWNGSYALESIPAALYCFLHSPDDPRASVLAAVNGGFDADTVGCMTGQLAGAWCGAQRLRDEAEPWWTGLEWRSVLQRLGDELAQAALQGVQVGRRIDVQ
ncbi:MAG: ADP-ribosylglycohydrolase family protein, partial [Candidatus Xenobia bacterium]